MTDIKKKFHQFCMANYNPLPVSIVRGKESMLYDDNGKDYVDLAGGIAVTALGHAHPKLMASLHNAMHGVWHLSNYFTNQAAVDLAERLCAATFADKVFFANSGSEVNEAALKLARKYGNEHGKSSTIVSCLDGFHGRTLFAVSVGGQTKYSEPFAPLPAGITHTAFNDCDALARAIDDSCCACIIEPVQGEGGVIPASKEFLQCARELCDRHNALLIFDEIQCGMGRSGALFAYMQYGVTPDILTCAKALGCGVPIGAMLMQERFGNVLSPGSHGSTFGGNPLACAVAATAFDIINHPDTLATVAHRHALFVEQLRAINARLDMFADIRGHGLLIGCELQPSFRQSGMRMVHSGLEHGVVFLVAAGGQTLRFAPSLLISENQLTLGVERLEKTLHTFVHA